VKIKDVNMDQGVAEEQFKTYLWIMNEATITQPTDRRICGMLISGPKVKVVDATVPLLFSPFYDINDPSVYQFLRTASEVNWALP
jgi:hypothetical protein